MPTLPLEVMRTPPIEIGAPSLSKRSRQHAVARVPASLRAWRIVRSHSSIEAPGVKVVSRVRVPSGL